MNRQGSRVAGLPGVDDEHPPPASAKHERRAQPGRTAAHNQHVKRVGRAFRAIPVLDICQGEPLLINGYNHPDVESSAPGRNAIAMIAAEKENWCGLSPCNDSISRSEIPENAAMLLMAENQDGRVIWVVVELHRPKQRIRSRIVLHLGEYRNRDEAEAAFLERLATNPALRTHAERWAVSAADVLSDRKARARFLMFGVFTGGIADYADSILRQREQQEEQARARARAALWSMSGPLDAFSTLGLSSLATIDEIKAAYRQKALQLHPDRGGDHLPMVKLNAAYEAAVAYATWRS